MTSIEVVSDYLTTVASDPASLERLRDLTTDDFVVHDPLMNVEGVDDLINQLTSIGSSEAEIEVVEVVGSDSVVAAMTLFTMPDGSKMHFSQWFWLREHRINTVRVVYDPRAFLGM